MANLLKVLGQVAPGAASLTTLYTVPALTTSVVSSLCICNRSTSPTSFRIAIRPSGAAISNEMYLYYDVEILGRDTFTSTIGISLGAGDVISVYATLATLSFNAFGQENS